MCACVNIDESVALAQRGELRYMMGVFCFVPSLALGLPAQLLPLSLLNGQQVP